MFNLTNKVLLGKAIGTPNVPTGTGGTKLNFKKWYTPHTDMNWFLTNDHKGHCGPGVKFKSFATILPCQIKSERY